MKLIKFISRSTNYSRRDAEELIKNEKIRVNDEIITQYSYSVDPASDTVYIGNEEINKREKKYFKFNKPKGYVCSKKDKFSKTIYDYLGRNYLYLNYVGRLDKDSEGLLIMTNDGDLQYKLTHPSYEIKREYKIHLNHKLKKEDQKKILNGIRDNGEILKADSIKKINNKRYILSLHTGRKREIKRMIRNLGIRILNLKRIKYANINIDNLENGEIKKIDNKKINKLKDFLK